MDQTIRLRQKKMNIQILEMIEGARQAKGLTVIIDVFRAFSLECYLMAKHPAQLCPVGAKETAYAWKENHPEAVLIGERHGVILPGFQYGNSPSQTADVDLEGKTLIHTTSAGTQGIVNAAGARRLHGKSGQRSGHCALHSESTAGAGLSGCHGTGRKGLRAGDVYVPAILRVWWKEPLLIWRQN